MSKAIRQHLVLTVLFLFISMPVPALELSADAVFITKGHQMKAKMYSKDGLFRMEIKKPRPVITITRIDRNIMWTIMPEEGIYMERPVDPDLVPRVEFENELERKLLGSENVGGRPTKKYLITYKNGERTGSVFQWWATDIDFPVKTAATDNSWVQEYKNVKVGPQPDHLFEVPPGVTKFQVP